MRFATLEGKLVQSGGMVVKNVAGLDMAKLMVGSFGTLAAIASVNFRLFPMPVQTRSFLVSAGTAAEAVAARNRVLNSVLQPAALDVLNHHAAGRVGLSGYVLAVRAAGSPAVIERYARELPEAAVLDGSDESAFWRRIQEFTPEFMVEHSEGAVVRVSSTLSQLEPALRWDSPVVARGGSGVAYIHFAHWRDAAEANAAVEWAPPAAKDQLTLWPNPGGDLDIMKRIKGLFDPGSLLNRGRLYGRI
jgi:glycolate oxidase FAD binding subunit